MAIQSVANNPLGSYPVLITKTADNSQVQSINSILPFISNRDDDGAGTVYTGYAVSGSANSEAKWFIMKSVTLGTLTTIRFASAPFTMNKIWNNRVSLSYS
jgi:hypothetical protein